MAKLLISIIIPFYNTEKYARDCLDSILEQNFDNKKYEIICVDDGSPDCVGMILDEYEKNYSEIKVLHKENGGVSSARYYGFKESNGEYIWFIDSDDFVNNNSLFILENAIKNNNHPDHIEFKYYSFKYNGSDKRESLVSNSTEMKISGGSAIIWNSIYKSEFLCLYNIPDSFIKYNLSYAEDTLFSFLVTCNENSKVVIDDCLIFYRINQDSLSFNKSIKNYKKRADNFVKVAHIIRDALDNYELIKFNCSKSYIAYIFMCREWVLFELLACMPTLLSIKFFIKLIKCKLFPIKIPDSYDISKEDTLKWAYGNSKCEKWLNCHSHRIYGYILIYFYYTKIRLKTIFKIFLIKLIK